ncbi:MAG TPA: response regulator transcription factor [Flavobacteriaceae bacterium]|nr:response regulator transcription factor [Flavobacteriaceae bacterium]
MSNFSVIVVDDHSVVRQGVAITLKKHFPKSTIYYASNFEELLLVLSKQDDIQLILLDINIPGGNSPEMITKIKEQYQDLKVLIFSGYEEKHYAIRYIQAGANGYLNKNEEEEEIVFALRKVMSTGKYISTSLKDNLLEMMLDKKLANPLDSLSSREFEIAKMLADGYGNLEVSTELDIHMSTVSTYKNRIFKKLKLENVISLAELFKVYSS